MAQNKFHACGKCGHLTHDPFVPDEVVNTLLDPRTTLEPCPTIVRCWRCADLELDARGTRYVALAVVKVARQYGSLQQVPPEILARHRRMLPDLPAGC